MFPASRSDGNNDDDSGLPDHILALSRKKREERHQEQQQWQVQQQQMQQLQQQWQLQQQRRLQQQQQQLQQEVAHRWQQVPAPGGPKEEEEEEEDTAGGNDPRINDLLASLKRQNEREARQRQRLLRLQQPKATPTAVFPSPRAAAGVLQLPAAVPPHLNSHLAAAAVAVKTGKRVARPDPSGNVLGQFTPKLEQTHQKQQQQHAMKRMPEEDILLHHRQHATTTSSIVHPAKRRRVSTGRVAPAAAPPPVANPLANPLRRNSNSSNPGSGLQEGVADGSAVVSVKRPGDDDDDDAALNDATQQNLENPHDMVNSSKIDHLLADDGANGHSSACKDEEDKTLLQKDEKNLALPMIDHSNHGATVEEEKLEITLSDKNEEDVPLSEVGDNHTLSGDNREEGPTLQKDETNVTQATYINIDETAAIAEFAPGTDDKEDQKSLSEIPVNSHVKEVIGLADTNTEVQTGSPLDSDDKDDKEDQSQPSEQVVNGNAQKELGLADTNTELQPGLSLDMGDKNDNEDQKQPSELVISNTTEEIGLADANSKVQTGEAQTWPSLDTDDKNDQQQLSHLTDIVAKMEAGLPDKNIDMPNDVSNPDASDNQSIHDPPRSIQQLRQPLRNGLSFKHPMLLFLSLFLLPTLVSGQQQQTTSPSILPSFDNTTYQNDTTSTMTPTTTNYPTTTATTTATATIMPTTLPTIAATAQQRVVDTGSAAAVITTTPPPSTATPAPTFTLNLNLTQQQKDALLNDRQTANNDTIAPTNPTTNAPSVEGQIVDPTDWNPDDVQELDAYYDWIYSPHDGSRTHEPTRTWAPSIMPSSSEWPSALPTRQPYEMSTSVTFTQDYQVIGKDWFTGHDQAYAWLMENYTWEYFPNATAATLMVTCADVKGYAVTGTLVDLAGGDERKERRERYLRYNHNNYWELYEAIPPEGLDRVLQAPTPVDGGSDVTIEDGINHLITNSTFEGGTFPPNGTTFSNDTTFPPDIVLPTNITPGDSLLKGRIDYTMTWQSNTLNTSGLPRKHFRFIMKNLERLVADMQAIGINVTAAGDLETKVIPTDPPTRGPTHFPSEEPSEASPSHFPTVQPSLIPSGAPSIMPSARPTANETQSTTTLVVIVVISVMVAVAIMGVMIFFMKRYNTQKQQQVRRPQGQNGVEKPSLLHQDDYTQQTPTELQLALPEEVHHHHHHHPATQSLAHSSLSTPPPHPPAAEASGGVLSTSGESLLSNPSLISGMASSINLKDDSLDDYEADSTSILQDEFDSYKDKNLEKMRQQVEGNVAGFDGMMCQALTKAILDENDIDGTRSPSPLEWWWGVNEPLLSGVEIEATALWEVTDWLKRHMRSSGDSKLSFMQELLNKMVSSVRHGVIGPEDASRTIHECSALLGLPLASDLPVTTALISGLRKTVSADDIVDVFQEFGEIDVAAVAANQRGFGLVRFKNPKSIDRAMRKILVDEIVVQEVAVHVKVLGPNVNVPIPGASRH